MHTLAWLLKHPSDSFKAFNDRLFDTCLALRPTAARVILVGQQPAVILLDVDEDELPALRVAVCPLDASDEAMARLTEERMAAILAVAQASGDAEVIVAETDPACIALLVWALPGLPPPTTPVQENDPVAASHALPAGPHLHNRDAVINLEPDERLEFTLTPERARRAASGDEAPSTSATTVPMVNHPTPVDPASVTAQASVIGGRPLFGFRRRGGRLVADPEEAPIVATILAGNDADLTLDRILIRLMEEHGAWVREHWAPKERGRLVVRILDREDAYRRDLLPALAVLDGRADGDAANGLDGAAA